MKTKILAISIALFIVSLLGACATAATTTAAAPTSAATSILTTEFADAANLRSQLAYGILLMDGTAQTVSPEQAAALKPLLQAIMSLSGDDTTASEELTAVQDQIALALSPEQLQAIKAMEITNADLQGYYAQFGIVLPTPIPGVTKVPGSGSGKTEAEKAASQATAAASGQTTGSGQVAKSLLYEKVIEYLDTIRQ